MSNTQPKKTLKRLESRKSHSWWWDSHISPRNNKWLADNLEEMDRSVKRMLKLIEEEGDSFSKKAEMYYQKRPQLISQVEEFYRMYRSLAERYDNLTGELRKNVPSKLQTQGSGVSDAGSEAGSSPVIPVPERRRQSRRKSRQRAAGFDVFLGNGGGSHDNLEKAESDESSSSSSDSESDSDDGASSNKNNNHSGPQANGDGAGLSKKIIELEVELRDVKEKLRNAWEENSAARFKVSESGHDQELLDRIAWYEEELNVTDGKLRQSEEEIARLKFEIQKTNESLQAMSSLQTQLDSALKDIEIRDNELFDVNEKLRIAEEENSAALSKFSENGNDEELPGKIAWYEEELKVANGKLWHAEEEIARLNFEIEKTNESFQALSSLQTQLDSALKDIEVRDNELELEKSRAMELQYRIAGLNVTGYVDKVHEALEEELRLTNKKLEASEAEISRLKLEVEKNKLSSEAMTHDLHVESPSATNGVESKNIELGSENNGNAGLEGDVLDHVSTIKGLEEELRVKSKKLCISEEEIARLKLELEGAKTSLKHIELREAELQDRNKTLEVNVSKRDQEIQELKVLQDRTKTLEVDISNRDKEIHELKVAISEADKKTSLEKTQFETVISCLKESQFQLERELKNWELRVQSLEEEIKKAEGEKTELRVLQGTREAEMHAEMERLKAEIGERGNQVEELNKSLDALKLKYDMLTADRDGLNAKVSTLVANVGSRDDKIGQMEEHLHRLHLEHVELITGCEVARKQVEEQRRRLRDLEEEVDRQRVVISEGAEEKREAIRQLCFSLEHYRNSYHQLRQAFLVHKRPASRPVLIAS